MTKIKELRKIHDELVKQIKESQKVVSFLSDKIFELEQKR